MQIQETTGLLGHWSKKMKIIYKVENIETGRKFEFDSNEKLLICKNEGDLGKLERWIDLESASDFEKSREDDRREFLENNVLKIEIHVPDDFTIQEENITDKYEEQLKFRKNQKRKEFANDTLIFINTIIQDWTVQNKLTLLSREDVKGALTFLTNGSIEQSLSLVMSLPTDSLLTQEVKDKVIAYLTDKVGAFNAIVWE